jgi:hypothetical protein
MALAAYPWGYYIMIEVPISQRTPLLSMDSKYSFCLLGLDGFGIE